MVYSYSDTLGMFKFTADDTSSTFVSNVILKQNKLFKYYVILEV